VRVCLDTNVLVAAFATRGLCADVLRAVLAEHDLVVGDVILAELRRVLATKFKLPADRIESIEAVFAPFPSVPKPDKPASAAIRDPADRWIVATAVANVALAFDDSRHQPGFANELGPVHAFHPAVVDKI